MVRFITKLCRNLEKIGIYPHKFLLDRPFLWVTFNTPVMKELESNFLDFYRNTGIKNFSSPPNNINNDIINLKYEKLLEKEKTHLFNLLVMINAFNASIPEDYLHHLVFSHRRLHTKIISDIPTMIEAFEKFADYIKDANSHIGRNQKR